MDNKYILKIGGSLLFNDNLELRERIFTRFTEVLRQSDNIVGIVVGGGRLARAYIKAARTLKASEASCDIFGIHVSRLNTRLLITALEDKAFPEPIKSVEEALVNRYWNKILIAGGFVPGQSTTSVAFQIAETLRATDLLILTDVDGIFDKDPKKYQDAIKYDEIDLEQLEKVIYKGGGKKQSAAGEYRIFDAVSFQIMKRSKINVRLINGEKISKLKKIILDKQYDSNIGTKIVRNSTEL